MVLLRACSQYHQQRCPDFEEAEAFSTPAITGPVDSITTMPCRQLGPVVRSPEAATAGGGGHGLSVSLLERFIHRNQARAGDLISRGLAPATGRLYSTHSALAA